MLRDITIGQYYPVDSVIHRLDPRTKIIGTIVYIIALFLVKNLLGFGIAIIALAALIFPIQGALSLYCARSQNDCHHFAIYGAA